MLLVSRAVAGSVQKLSHFRGLVFRGRIDRFPVWCSSGRERSVGCHLIPGAVEFDSPLPSWPGEARAICCRTSWMGCPLLARCDNRTMTPGCKSISTAPGISSALGWAGSMALLIRQRQRDLHEVRVAIAPRNDSDRFRRRFAGHNENCYSLRPAA